MIACVCICMAPIVGSLTEYSLKYSGRVPHRFSGKGQGALVRRTATSRAETVARA